MAIIMSNCWIFLRDSGFSAKVVYSTFTLTPAHGNNRRKIILAWAALFVASAVLFLPQAPAFQQPSHESLPNYDRRGAETQQPLEKARAASIIELQNRVPSLHIDFDPIRGAPRRILSPTAFLSGAGGTGGAITPRSAGARPPNDPHAPIAAFLNEHSALFGHGAEILSSSRLIRDYLTAHNGLRTVVREQHLDQIPVYEALLAGHISQRGELVNLSSQFMSNLEQAADAGTPNRALLEAAPLLSAIEAVVLAGREIGEELAATAVLPMAGGPDGAEQRQRFKAEPLPGHAMAKLVWLAMDRSTLRLCWAVELTRRVGAERFRVLIDVQTGEPLLRRCLTVYLSEATYRVFTNASPSPLFPGDSSPTTNQPPLVSRSLVTLAALFTNASPIGWISDGENETRGNNVDAHLDLNADDLPDLPRPHGMPFRVFDFPEDLSQGPGTYHDAAVVQLFYWCNWMHDQLYELGFTEAAGNFQKDNFARGGAGNDALQADSQDGSGFNNANFTPTDDGESPRVQMYVFDGSRPNRDGDLDATIILHEYTHGLSTRLVGGGVGIYGLQTAGMGEGWSDFYALTLLSSANDDIHGSYVEGGYVTYQFFGLTENYYYGIRRYPYTTDLAKNPLTFKDIDPAQASPHDGAPISPIDPFTPFNANEVHHQGEVWCVTLGEARANLIQKYGFARGRQLILQLVTDGMKLGPPNPNFLEARDAIIQADLVDNSGLDVDELWRAFAKRGMGFSATAPPSATTAGVHEAFDLPDALLILPSAPFISSGPMGGPLLPNCMTYVLTNHTSNAVSWASKGTEPWLTVAPASGKLAPGAAINITVCLANGGKNLALGNYVGSILFSNLSSHVAQTRDAHLRVMDFVSMPFVEDFESGMFQSYWMVTGTGDFRSQVTTNDGPHGGRFHLTMDSKGSGNYARNEVTLGVDLGGYTNVMLRFWAKQFNDEPDGPPPSPFIDGADFDGVAISQDGVAWHEAQGLRDLQATNTEWVVDLDATIAAHGLAYNSTFRVRFNHYDDFSIPTDGIAIDDISLTGVANRRLIVTVPEAATEGEGTLSNQGRVTLAVPASADLTVRLASSDTSKVKVPAAVTIPAGATQITFDLFVQNNFFLDGNRTVVISATAGGYFGQSDTITVHDNERATLKLTLPSIAREGEGTLSQAGIVTMSAKPPKDILVTLSSSETNKVQVPATVIIPAGRTKAVFDLFIIDNHAIDGSRAVTITAHVDNWIDGRSVINVLDNESPRLSLGLPHWASESDGLRAGVGTVRIPGTLETNLVVFLSSSNTTKVLVPASVVIGAGSDSAVFDLAFVDNSISDGLRSVIIAASAPGFGMAVSAITVFDDETPPVPYQPNPDHLAVGVPVTTLLSWRGGVREAIVNGGFETGDFTGWKQDNLDYGAFVINNGTFDPDGSEGPLPPLDGKFSAMTEQIGGGTHTLYQDLLIPPDAASATLRWVDQIRNHAGEFALARQEFRVEIRNMSNDFLALAFATKPGDPATNSWTKRSFDLTGFRGQEIRLAFVETDHLGYFNLHLDDISLFLGEPAPTSFDVYFGTNGAPGPGTFLGNTTNQNWDLPPLALNTTYYWRVVSRRGQAQAAGPLWQFMTRGVGELDHFEWSAIPPTQFVNQAFPVTLTAKDDINQTITNFNSSVSLRALPGAGTSSAVVITEIDTGPSDKVEFANVSGRPISLSGWQVIAYDSQSWPGPRFGFTLPTNTVAAIGDVFVLNYSGISPGAYPNFFAGTNVFWNGALLGNPIAVLLQDNAGNLVDFVCAGGADPAQITEPKAIPSEQWIGYPVAANTNINLTYQRIGNTDHNDNSDWTMSMNNVGQVNPGLSLPFLPQNPISLSPANLTGFIAGVWSGKLVVGSIVPELTLLASDGLGHYGLAEPFQVGAMNDISVAFSRYPNLALVGDALNYIITITNTGPMSAANVTLEDALPAGATFVSAASSQGLCANVGGIVFCNLGPLAAGDSVSITIVLKALRAGLLTNTATINRPEAESSLLNNIASAITAVDLPLLSIMGTGVTEGNSGTVKAAFLARLSAPCTLPVSVNYATSDNSAIAGQDYISTNGTLVFPPAVTSQTLTVQVIGDTAFELQESFFVNLSSPTNAAIAIGQARGRIFNDDPPPTLSIQDAIVSESAPGTTTKAVFTVRLTGSTRLPVSVSFATQDGTAAAGIDYAAQSGLLVFAPGLANQTISIEVMGDAMFKSNATFSVILSNPSGATIAQAVGACTIIDNGISELDHFMWSVFPSPQYATMPFLATITAQDRRNNIVTSFNGTAAIKAIVSSQTNAVGSGGTPWAYPLGTLYHDSRIQTIYLAGEIGSAGRVSALSLNVQNPPGQTLSNWTIRIKHTLLSSYDQPAWEASGWNTVYQRDQTVTAGGWVTFFFDLPFHYNGTNNLMIDLSFNNSSYTTNGACFCTTTKPLRSIFFQTDSAFGPPLEWNGAYSPPPSATNQVPNIRLLVENSTQMTPGNPIGFDRGRWMGPIIIQEPATNVFLRILDQHGHLGISNPFAVESSADANGDGLPDAWQIRYFGSTSDLRAAPGADPDDDGLTNVEEFRAGTNPLDASNSLRLTAVRFDAGSVRLSFPTISGKRYRLERSDDLAGNKWMIVGDEVAGTGTAVELTDAGGTRERGRFYRLVLIPL